MQWLSVSIGGRTCSRFPAWALRAASKRLRHSRMLAQNSSRSAIGYSTILKALRWLLRKQQVAWRQWRQLDEQRALDPQRHPDRSRERRHDGSRERAITTNSSGTHSPGVYSFGA